MDISAIARLASSIAETGTKQEVGLAVLKRAQDIQSATATQLIDAIQVASPVPNLPPHLGNKINTTA
jgi:Putative motility protein